MQRKDENEEAMKEVKLSTLGGLVQTFRVPEETTLSELLVKGGYPADSSVRCNGEVYNDGDIPDDGDVLTVIQAQSVKGN